MPRRGATNETYRIVPTTAPTTPGTPSLTASFNQRSNLGNVKPTPHGYGYYHHRHDRANGRQPRPKNPGFMTRGARANGMDPMVWMSSVKVEREIDSGQNSMFGSRATSIERASQAAELHRRSDGSLSRSMEFEAANEEGDAEDLVDEYATPVITKHFIDTLPRRIWSVNKALGNKVKFVKVSIEVTIRGYG